MKNFIRKAVAVFLSLGILCSGISMNQSHIYAAQNIRNGQLELSGDYQYEYYGVSGDCAIFVTNLADGYFTADSEISIVKGNGDSYTFQNKNKDGTRRFVAWNNEYDMAFYDENNRTTIVDEEFNFIGGNKDYKSFCRYEDNENTLYFVFDKASYDPETGYIKMDVIDKNNNMIKENIDIIDGNSCVIYKFYDMYIMCLWCGSYTNTTIMDEEFNILDTYMASEAYYIEGMEYFVYVTNEGDVYTVDKELNQYRLDVESGNYWFWDGYTEGYYLYEYEEYYEYMNEYIIIDEHTVTENSLYKDSYWQEIIETDNGMFIYDKSYFRDEGVLVEGNIIPYDTFYEMTKIDSDYPWLEEGYEYYCDEDKSFIYAGINTYEMQGGMVFAKCQDYSIDKAFVVTCDSYFGGALKTNGGKGVVAYTADYDGICEYYIPTEDSWISVDGATQSNYFINDEENSYVDVYNYDGEYVKKIAYEDVMALTDFGLKVMSIEATYDEFNIGMIFNVDTQWSGVAKVLLMDCYDYALDKAMVIYEKEAVELIWQKGNRRIVEIDGIDIYYSADTGWKEVEYFDYATEICIYWDEDVEKYVLLGDVNNPEQKIVLEDLIEIEAKLSNVYVLSEYQEGGTYMYTYAMKSAVDYGDCNGDGKINSLDTVLLMKHIAGYKNLAIEEAACDVNEDGKVNGVDAVMILKYIAGYDVAFGQ